MEIKTLKLEIDQINKSLDVHRKVVEDLEYRLNVILNTEIMNYMLSQDIEKIEVDGMKFVYSNDLFASIKADYKREAIRWLKDRTGTDKAKEMFLVETSETESLMKELNKLKECELIDDINYDTKIHWKSLQSIVKGLMMEGIQAPEEFFSVFYKPQVKIS